MALSPAQQEFVTHLVRLPFAKKQQLIPRMTPPSKPLHVVYLLINTAVCGGAKIIMEHAHHLTHAGVQVTLISHYARPTWFAFDADYKVIPFDKDLTAGIPPCDVIVATYWDHIQAAIETHIAPVIYFEQGDYHLFDRGGADPSMLHFIDTQIGLPSFLMTVSHKAAQIIDELYHQPVTVIPNAINTSVFSPASPSYPHSNPYLLMMGGDATKFKGTDEILAAYGQIKPYVPNLDLIWITPYEPTTAYSEASLIFVSPSQEVISSLYRGAFAFISASHYESFSLPVLEAMSCGCPVITTPNDGVTEYAIDEVNCLFTPISDPHLLIQNVFKLIYNPALRNHLIQGGLITASHYSWETTTLQLIHLYEKVAQLQDADSSL